MIDIKSISQDQRKYKNRTPNDLNIKLIAIMVNFLFQYRWWAFPFANTFSRNFTSDWKLSKWCSCFPLRTYSFSVDLKTYLTAHNLKNLPYTFQVFFIWGRYWRSCTGVHQTKLTDRIYGKRTLISIEFNWEPEKRNVTNKWMEFVVHFLYSD